MILSSSSSGTSLWRWVFRGGYSDAHCHSVHPMTSPLTLIVDADGRKMAKPYAEVARALIEEEEKSQLRGAGPEDWKFYLPEARIAINRLRELGFINDIGLVAIKAEEAESQ